MVVVGKAHLKINLGRIMQTFTDKTVNSSTTTQPFLLVSNVAKEYPSPEGVYTVLDGVDLQVNEGEFV